MVERFIRYLNNNPYFLKKFNDFIINFVKL